jgi:hypothetical protein
VAGGTIGGRKGSACRRVRRIIRLLPGRQVAPGIPAVIRLNRQIVIVVDVAVRASVHFARGSHLVRIRQRKTRGRVVKIRRQPGNRIVAIRAGRNRKHRGRCRMLGVRGLLPRCQVAPGIPAVCRHDLQTVVVADVAIQTGNIGVPVGEREIDRGRGVVYGGAQPTVKRVTVRARLWKLTGHVVRVFRLLKVPHMAGVAGRGKALELAYRSALVAVLTLHRGVRPQQRKAILVILDLLHRHVPSLHGMALRAIRAHLPLVDVGVTVLALLADVCKHRLDMALRALHLFVHAAQRILRFVVVKLGYRSDRAPSIGGVAVFTRYLQRPMRASARAGTATAGPKKRTNQHSI